MRFAAGHLETGERDELGARHAEVEVAQLGLVGRARTGVEVGQRAVGTARGLRLGDAGLGIGDVAELDRAGWAGLLAGDLDGAVADVDVGRIAGADLGLDLGFLDALDAIGALLHDAAHAHGDVGVLLELREVGRILDGLLRSERSFVQVAVDALVVVEEVEAADLVRAVVRAVAGADAAVVGHRVEALVVVDGGVGGADGLARGGLAMLAGDAHEGDLRVFGDRVAGGGAAVEEVAVQADPVHVAALEHLLAADDGDVVLGLASGHAGVAAGARVEVDRHAPLLELRELVLMALPDGDVRGDGVGRVLVGGVATRGGDGLGRRGHGAVLAVDGRSVAIDAELGEVLVLPEVLDIAFADDVASFHRPVVLHVADGDGDVGERELGARADGGFGGGDERVGVEAVAGDATGEAFVDARGDAAGDAAAEAELEAEGVVGHAGHDEDRSGDGLAADGDGGDAAHQAAVDELVDVPVERADLVDDHRLRLDGELGGELRADEDDVLPDGLGHGIRSLGEPAVVGLEAVAGVEAGEETDFERVEGEGRRGEGLDLGDAHGGFGRGEGGAGEHAFGEPGGEGFVGDVLREGIEGLADERVRLLVGTGEGREDVELGDRREERVDHRLHRHVGAVERAAVGPALEVVRGGEEGAGGGLHGGRGLVEGRTMVAEADDLLGGLDGGAEVHVGRRVVDGVAAEDDEGLGRLGDERGDRQRGGSRSGDVLDGGGEGLVGEEDGAMRVGGQMVAGDDEGFALGGLDEVGHAFGDPLRVDVDARDLALEGGGVGGTLLREDFGGEEDREAGDVRGSGAETVVGGGAGQREDGFDDVEARHLLGFGGRVGATGGGVGAGVFDGCVMGAEEVAVEAQHAAGLGVIRERAGAEDGVGAALRDRGVFDPAGLRVGGLERGDEAGARGRSGRAGEESETGAGVGLGVGGETAEETAGGGDGEDGTVGGEGSLRTVRIVHVEHAGLGGLRGSAAVGAVARIAFDLGRAMLMRLDEDRLVGELPREGRSVIRGDAGDGVLRLLGVGERVVAGLAATGEAEAGETERSAHEHQELAAFDGGDGGGAVEELALGAGAELGRLVALVKAAPVRRTGRLAGLRRGVFEDFLAHRKRRGGLAVAARAALGRIDLPVVHELRAVGGLLGGSGGLEAEVVDLVDRAQDLLGIAVAIEAEGHVEGLLLADDDLLVDASVALDAADAAVHVHGVVEVDVVRHLVHLDPADRFAGLDALLDERQRGAVALHLAVAVPAGVGRRHVRVARLVHVVVAIAAVEAEDRIRTGVEGVVEGDGLVRRVSDVQILVGGVLFDRGGHDHGGDQEADEDLERGGVDRPGEEVTAGGRAVEEFEELAHRVQTKGLAGFLTEEARKAATLRNPNLRGFSRFSMVHCG